MLHDIEFFQSRLSKIDGFEDTGEYLLGIIRSREVKSAPAAPATAAPPVSSAPPPAVEEGPQAPTEDASNGG